MQRNRESTPNYLEMNGLPRKAASNLWHLTIHWQAGIRSCPTTGSPGNGSSTSGHWQSAPHQRQRAALCGSSLARSRIRPHLKSHAPPGVKFLSSTVLALCLFFSLCILAPLLSASRQRTCITLENCATDWRLECLEEVRVRAGRGLTEISDRHKTERLALDWTAKPMNDLLSQLGNLFLGAIPTGVLLGFVWLGYRVIVQGKLTSVLSERRQHTEGAVEKSRAAISAAEARSAEYEQRIRDAKLAIYKAQELRRRKQLEARVAQLAEAHQAAEIHLQSGRRAIDAELRRAKAGLEMHVNALVNQIVRAVLEPATDSAVTEVKR